MSEEQEVSAPTAPKEAPDKLVTRARFNTLIATLVGSVITLGITKTWDHLHGPSHTLVDNMPTQLVIPAEVHAKAELDAATAEQIRKLIDVQKQTLQALRAVAPSQPDKKRAETNKQIEELKEKISALEAGSSVLGTPSVGPASGLVLDDSPSSMESLSYPFAAYAKIIYPEMPGGSTPSFSLPPGVKGLILNPKPAALLNFQCPTPNSIPGRGSISFSFSIENEEKRWAVSPPEVSVMQDDRPAAFVQYFATHVPIKVGNNVFAMQTNFEPGKHVLRVGYFLVKQTATKYPVLYVKDCPLIVLPESAQ